MSTRGGRGRRGGSSSAASSRASSTLPASSSDVELEPVSSEALSSNDGRIPLLRTAEGELALHKDFSRVITKSFKRISNPTGINWKATPEDVKDQYFEEFRKNYSWDERWEDEVRRLWEKRASTRFPDFLYDVKVCRKPNDEGKPGYICDDQWKTLCAYWDTPEAIRKSERASKARLSEPDGLGSGISKHRGGSKSVAVRAHEMALKEGIPVKKCVYDSFRNLHVKQDGTYTYKKAEDVDARVREIAEQQGESADLSQIYVDEVMGGRLDKKQRMFGTGTLARSLVSGSSQTSHAHSQHVDARFEEMQRQLQEEREHRLRLEDSLRVTHEMLQQFLRSQQTRSSGSGGSDLPPSGDNPQL